MGTGEPPSLGVIGLGYVGLPLAVAFAEAGGRVVGVDADPMVVAGLGIGASHIEDIPDDRLTAVLGNLTTTTDYAALRDVDALVVCVPTPLTVNREPEMGPLLGAAASIADVLRPGQLVVLESTTWPGTTRERLVPILARSGLTPGEDVHVAFSPERIDPGRTDFTLRTTPKTVGGLTPACAERARELYAHVCDEVVVVSSPEAAEMSKLLENIFRSVNIALVNELAMLCERMGVDVWEVIDAAATKPYGFMRFDPGPGMGGHCLPVDPFYLTWRAREFDFPTEFIELAGKINQQMPYHCVQRAERQLNEAGLPVRGTRVLVVGVSYKPGVGDVRESPALKVLSLLAGLGADLVYHDPHVPRLPTLGLVSSDLDAAIADAQLAIIVTAHPGVDHERIATEVSQVLDLRGVTRRGAAVRAPGVSLL